MQLQEPFTAPDLTFDPLVPEDPNPSLVALQAPGLPYVQLDTTGAQLRECRRETKAGHEWHERNAVECPFLGPWTHVGNGRFQASRRPSEVERRTLYLAQINSDNIVRSVTPLTVYCLPGLPSGDWLSERDGPKVQDVRVLTTAMTGARTLEQALRNLHSRVSAVIAYDSEGGFSLGVPEVSEGIGTEAVNDATDFVAPWLRLILERPDYWEGTSQCHGQANLFGGVLTLLGWHTELWTFRHPAYNHHAVCAIRKPSDGWMILDPSVGAELVPLDVYFGAHGGWFEGTRRPLGVEQPRLFEVAHNGETTENFLHRVVPDDGADWAWLYGLAEDDRTKGKQPLALFVGHALPGWYTLAMIGDQHTGAGGFHRLDRARTTQVELTVGTGVDPMEPDRSVSKLNRRFLEPNANLRGTLSTADVVRGGIVTIGRK
ncbi:MAG: hypothetical protein ABMA64_39550 [Myxococcota bacterium]